MQELIVSRWRCQFDAFWTNDLDKAEWGFVLLDAGLPSLFGAQGESAAASPLHAEAEGLIWAMQELLKSRITEVLFESDSLSSEFQDFSIVYISRSLNVRADCLTKGGRTRVVSSPYVDAIAPSWLVFAGQEAAI
ncbi:hypothetical protein DY000_02001504 [Brassica cretica]|uniref:RNase H type-1 domain-containing protein n=1 Tax=Brassica cretica TaxID=69181 RepID=A0ABQ7CJM1_BRACR|nr:hypothetical protein DY000_02001504 [Brassica cretica]